MSPETQASRNVPALRRHFASCFTETYADRLTPAQLKQLIGALDNPTLGGLLPGADERLLTCGEGCEISGSAVWALRSGTTYIWGFYIRKGTQRKGIGRSLLRGILAALPSTCALRLQVLQSSTNATAFYRAFGFKVERHAQYELAQGYIEPVLLMMAEASDVRQRI